MSLYVEKIDTFAGHRDAIYAITAATEPTQFFSAGADGMVIRWNLIRPDLGELIARIPASVYGMTFDSVNNLLWVGQNFEGIHRIDPDTRQEKDSLKLTNAAIFDIQLVDNIALLALGDGTVLVIDQAAFAIRKHLKASDASARCIAINRISREFAIGYSDHTIKIFDLDTLELTFIIAAHAHSVFTVCYSPDGQLLHSGGRDAHLKTWSVHDQYQLQQDVVAHMFAINHIAYSPNHQWIVTASMDKSLKVWEAKTSRLLKVIDRARHAGHRTSVNKVLWTTHKNCLISGSDDRLLSIWEIRQPS
ncbi:MAG: WD40 repeat domain-containing protein [Siphonobacter sp.]